MSFEEFREVSSLLKLSDKDESLKKDANDYIENAKAVLFFDSEEKEDECFSSLRSDSIGESVPREEILRNAKGKNGGYFCLPERRESFE